MYIYFIYAHTVSYLLIVYSTVTIPLYSPDMGGMVKLRRVSLRIGNTTSLTAAQTQVHGIDNQIYIYKWKVIMY